jgi:hypothetical protein
MYVVELFLPITDNEGRKFSASLFKQVRKELTAKYGGLTSFTRAPAHGIIEAVGKAVHDDLVILEVMTEIVERDWWTDYRRDLEGRFRQDEVLIRATQIIKL